MFFFEIIETLYSVLKSFVIILKFVVSDVMSFDVLTRQICKKNLLFLHVILIIDDFAHKNQGTFWHI